nr:hypothetical protein CFP56_53237 [Quercus suber]
MRQSAQRGCSACRDAISSKSVECARNPRDHPCRSGHTDGCRISAQHMPSFEYRDPAILVKGLVPALNPDSRVELDPGASLSRFTTQQRRGMATGRWWYVTPPCFRSGIRRTPTPPPLKSSSCVWDTVDFAGCPLSSKDSGDAGTENRCVGARHKCFLILGLSRHTGARQTRGLIPMAKECGELHCTIQYNSPRYELSSEINDGKIPVMLEDGTEDEHHVALSSERRMSRQRCDERKPASQRGQSITFHSRPETPVSPIWTRSADGSWCARQRSIDVDAIVVKLEGESRSRLMSPGGGPANERPRPILEYHKILYRVQTVFPSPEIMEARTNMSGRATYTLPAGQHEYPFRFKIPFNNSCHADRGPVGPVIGINSFSGLELARPATQHVKKTLPPTMSGFPGEAEIRYFVKTTINRHSFFKENPRAYAPFNFLPIEPPRPKVTGSEIFARQRHSFLQFPDRGTPMKPKAKWLFGDKKANGPASPTAGDAPQVSVDVRLPQPPIITCNADLPLRIIVKRLNDSNEDLLLSSLQVSLIALTKIRAHDVFRTEQSSWIIMSRSNMGIALGSPTDPAQTETVLDDNMWRQQVLPNTVAPSFETCNISRSYQLDVRLGLSYPGGTRSSFQPQTIVLPLRLDVQVYSGIAPPPALLEAMARRPIPVPSKPTQSAATSANPTSEKLKMEASGAGFPTSYPPGSLAPMDATDAIPPHPVEIPSSSAQPGPSSSALQPPTYSEAPPSYEDAIATQIPPVAAPRPQYAPPPTVEDDLLSQDEKKGWRDV